MFARRRGACPRRAHVRRAPQPPVPTRLRRVTVQLPDDAPRRASDGRCSAVATSAPPVVNPRRHGRRTPHNLGDEGQGHDGWILLATRDLDGTFERVQASAAEVVQEPMEQPYGGSRLCFPGSGGQYGPHSGAALNRQQTCALTKPIRNREAPTAGPSLA